MRSGIVLVGGEARRAGGMEKYFFEICGRTFIDRLLETLRGAVDEIIIVARDEEQCRRFDPYPYVRCIPDMRRGIGPIGGLHAEVSRRPALGRLCRRLRFGTASTGRKTYVQCGC